MSISNLIIGNYFVGNDIKRWIYKIIVLYFFLVRFIEIIEFEVCFI